MVTQYIYLVSRITYLRQMFVCSLLKHITKCMVDTQMSIVTAYACYWKLQQSKYELWGRNITFPVVFDSFVSGKAKKALASNMHSGLCHTRLNALDFLHDNDLGNLGRSPQYSVLDLEHFSNLLWGLCGSCREWKHFCCTERTSQMALEIRHSDISHSRNDARTTLWRSRWKNDYSSSNNSAEEFFS